MTRANADLTVAAQHEHLAGPRLHVVTAVSATGEAGFTHAAAREA